MADMHEEDVIEISPDEELVEEMETPYGYKDSDEEMKTPYGCENSDQLSSKVETNEVPSIERMEIEAPSVEGMEMEAPFKVGDEFSSFNDLNKAIHTLEKMHCVNFWKRDSRTIKGAEGRTTKCIKPDLKYYSGGRDYTSSSSGLHPNQK